MDNIQAQETQETYSSDPSGVRVCTVDVNNGTMVDQTSKAQAEEIARAERAWRIYRIIINAVHVPSRVEEVVFSMSATAAINLRNLSTIEIIQRIGDHLTTAPDDDARLVGASLLTAYPLV